MRLLVVTLLALALGSAPARAATGSFEVPRLPGSPLPDDTLPTIAGPVPAGDAVAFGSGSSSRGWRVRVGVPGAGVRDVAAVPPQEASTLSLRASATRLALLRFARICRGDGCRYMQYDVTLDETLAGPLTGPLTKLACGPGRACGSGSCDGSQDRHRAALEGELLAISSCGGGSATLVNLATGATRPLSGGAALAVAGRFVAVAEGSNPFGQSRIVVRDLVSGAEIYRPGPLASSAIPSAQLAVLDDGSVFYTSLARGGLELVGASPSEPAGRALRRVARFAQIVGAGRAGVLLTTSPPGRLELVSLDGSFSRALDLPDLVAAPAFDGTTLTWARRICVTTAIMSWRLGDPPPVADLRCPTLRPSRATVTLPRSRLLRLKVSCPATSRGGCLGKIRLTAVRRGRTPRGRNGAERRYRLGSVDVALDPGERAHAKIRVRLGAARWVRRHSRLRLRIDATSAVKRSAQRPVGDRGKVSRSVRLRSAGSR